MGMEWDLRLRDILRLGCADGSMNSHSTTRGPSPTCRRRGGEGRKEGRKGEGEGRVE